jgi:hypothetical protein
MVSPVLFGSTRVMTALLRRGLLPLAASTIMVAGLLSLLVQALPQSISDVKFLLLLIVPFEIVGLFITYLLSHVLRWIEFDRGAALFSLTIAGGLLGTAMLVPLSEGISFELLLGTGCGAASALLWGWLNSDLFRAPS